MDPAILQRRSEDRPLQHWYELLRALSSAQARFIADEDPRDLFTDLLASVLALTESQHGFLAEVLPPLGGNPSLRMHAASDGIWDERSAGTWCHAAIKTGQPVIFSEPLQAGVDHGAAIRTFLGLPMYHHRELVGLLGLADRPSGYDAGAMEFLAPVLVTCGTLLASARADRRRHQAEHALHESQGELRLLAGKLLSAHEEERSALARELHDDLSQRLAALAIETAMLEVDCRSAPEPARKRLRDVKDRLVEVSTDVHNISRRLHPAILRDLGLSDAIQSECLRFSEREGIQVEFLGQDVPNLPSEVAICLYRIAQEGLRNIAKHAKAEEAHVTLLGEGAAVVLSIRDSGAGFDVASARSSGGVGLASMRERAWLVRGDIAVRSRPGQGTTIDVRVPLDTETR